MTNSNIKRVISNTYVQIFSLLSISFLITFLFDKKFETQLSLLEVFIYLLKQVVGIAVVSFVWIFIKEIRKGKARIFDIDSSLLKRVFLIFWIIVLVVNTVATIYFGPIT